MSALDDQDDDPLVAKVLQGDRRALEELLLRNYDWLERYVIRLIPADLRATVNHEDVIQDVYLRVFKKIELFQPEGRGQLFSWLQTIARNTVFDAMRKHKRNRGTGVSQLPSPPSASDSGELKNLMDELAVDEDAQVSRFVRVKELRQAFWVALGTLPDEYRRVIELLYIEEKSIDAAAEELNKSVDAIRGIRMRARKALQSALDRLSRFV